RLRPNCGEPAAPSRRYHVAHAAPRRWHLDWLHRLLRKVRPKSANLVRWRACALAALADVDHLIKRKLACVLNLRHRCVPMRGAPLLSQPFRASGTTAVVRLNP